MKIISLFKTDKALFLQTAGLYIFAAALPFSVTLIQGGILLFIAAGLWRRHKAGTFHNLPKDLRHTTLFAPWLAYLGAGVLAAAFGIMPAHSFAALNSDLLTAVSFLGLCLFLEPEQREPALNIYLAAITAAAIYGIAQALGGVAHGLDIRAHATSHPVRFGEIMVIGLALAISRVSSPENLTPRIKKVLYAATLLIVSAIVLSQTRGAYIGTALVFAAMLAIKRPPKRVIIPLIAAAAVLGLGLSMLNPTIRYKLGSIFKGANSAVTQTQAPDQSIGTRLILWKTGFKMIKDRPVLGGGPGSVKKLFPIYCPPPYPENNVWGSLHNLYIHQTAERGLVGLAALLTLFGAMFLAALRSFRSAPSAFTIWALTIILPWFSMNMTEITFEHVHTSYAVLFALAVSITASKSSSSGPL
jgi:putative inorganic carbon (HCO3(-)) transporter